ncbi:hypothetical protein SDC9_46816 [bioreactor metagenome]|uniref:Uncharacterized protein n=1 Tax=bioreactor metagenome TaxID=1076179 RepID=A0A644WAI5_9ZZZZ
MMSRITTGIVDTLITSGLCTEDHKQMYDLRTLKKEGEINL